MNIKSKCYDMSRKSLQAHLMRNTSMREQVLNDEAMDDALRAQLLTFLKNNEYVIASEVGAYSVRMGEAA